MTLFRGLAGFAARGSQYFDEAREQAEKIIDFVFLCLLYIPVPTRTRNISSGPWLLSPKVFKICFFTTIQCLASLWQFSRGCLLF